MAEKSKEGFSIRVTEDSSRITFTGTLRLQGRLDYEKIHIMLREAAQKACESLELDLRQLQFLNSPGVATISIFLTEMRDIGKRIVINGSRTIAWQDRILNNFSRLYDRVVVNLA